MSAVRKTRTSSPAETAPRIPCRTGERRNRSSPAGNGRPTRAPLELRGLPERPEREEREDEDDCPAPEEEPIGNRQVAHPADPVRQQRQGRTSSSAICRPRPSSSTSKSPGAVALKRIVAGAPGRNVGASGHSHGDALRPRARRSTTSSTCRPCLTVNCFTVGALSPGTEMLIVTTRVGVGAVVAVGSVVVASARSSSPGLGRRRRGRRRHCSTVVVVAAGSSSSGRSAMKRLTSNPSAAAISATVRKCGSIVHAG